MPVAVVTGASRGLGAALGRDLLARGFDVGLCATTEPPLEGVIRAVLDVSDARAVECFAADVARDAGPLDVWINNAGVLGPMGPLRDSDAQDWKRCIDVNLQGVVNGTRAFLAHRRTGRATLINIASRAATAPAPGLAAYGATKAAVVALTMSVAEEEKSSGLRAFVVLPPSIDTDMQNTLLSQDETVFPQVEMSRQRKRDGGVLPAAIAANEILSAVLDGPPNVTTVLDLTRLRTAE
jgi:benzil reductase ((S)-benzoin forming)